MMCTGYVLFLYLQSNKLGPALHLRITHVRLCFLTALPCPLLLRTLSPELLDFNPDFPSLQRCDLGRVS